jgi:O-6-methylguanine DNA methyltransferase
LKIGLSRDFQREVLSIIKKIPKGKVATYGQIAEKFKIQNAKCKNTNKQSLFSRKLENQNGKILARAVGNALHRNITPTVPCHRVVKSSGNVGGYKDGRKVKIRILSREGVEIKKGKIDLEKYGWRP